MFLFNEVYFILFIYVVREEGSSIYLSNCSVLFNIFYLWHTSNFFYIFLYVNSSIYMLTSGYYKIPTGTVLFTRKNILLLQLRPLLITLSPFLFLILIVFLVFIVFLCKGQGIPPYSNPLPLFTSIHWNYSGNDASLDYLPTTYACPPRPSSSLYLGSDTMYILG